MRVLCLHGVGSSGRILKIQLAQLVEMIGGDYEFFFVDGPVKSERGPGISQAIPGPFFSHTEGYTVAQMKDAHRTISSHIGEAGPFDGVLGFSQGASIALSYLLQHQIEFPEKPSPFKFALCFSSTIPLSRDPKCHAEVLDSLSDAQRRSLLPLRSDDLAGLGITQRIFVNRLARAVKAAVLCGRSGREFADDILLPGNDHLVPRILHPDLTRERLNIPTVHVFGKKDFPFMKEMTQNARNICEAELRRDVEHTGGHELPRTAKEIRAVVVELDWAARHCAKL